MENKDKVFNYNLMYLSKGVNFVHDFNPNIIIETFSKNLAILTDNQVIIEVNYNVDSKSITGLKSNTYSLYSHALKHRELLFYTGSNFTYYPIHITVPKTMIDTERDCFICYNPLELIKKLTEVFVHRHSTALINSLYYQSLEALNNAQ